MITESELKAIVGRTLPGGQYTVQPYVDWLVHDVVGAEADGQVAHPIFGFVAGLRGKGISLDELFAICGATAADGPMFGEHETELHRPLRQGETYTVSGEFLSAERKQSQRTGIFDVVGFSMVLTDAAGERAVTTYNSFIFPRRDS